MSEPKGWMSRFFDVVLVDLGREITRGVLEGLCSRYTPQDLEWHIRNDTDLLRASLTIGTPEDRATIERLRRLTAKYRRHGATVRRAVTVDWTLERLRVSSPAYWEVLETPRGRVWLARNLRSGMDQFFPD